MLVTARIEVDFVVGVENFVEIILRKNNQS